MPELYPTLDAWRAAGRPAWEVTDVWEVRFNRWLPPMLQFGWLSGLSPKDAALEAYCGSTIRLVSRERTSNAQS